MDHIVSDGTIVESIRSIFKVELDSGQHVNCTLGGKMRLNKINLIVGDRVTVKMSAYDLSRGIITFRLKKAK